MVSLQLVALRPLLLLYEAEINADPFHSSALRQTFVIIKELTPIDVVECCNLTLIFLRSRKKSGPDRI